MFSRLVLNSNVMFDVFEDVSYYLILSYIYFSILNPSPRQMLVFGLAFLWLFRLTAFLGYRIYKREKDFRFEKLDTNIFYNVFGWTSGGTWCLINGMCLWVCASIAPVRSRPLSDFDVIGVVIFSIGFMVETVADYQKYVFNADYSSGTNKKWITTGLWKFSRHPNYCGEITVWIGLSLLCVNDNIYLPNGRFLCILSPIWSACFLFFTSLMLLEKRGDSKWDDNPEYIKYKAKTPVLFPEIATVVGVILGAAMAWFW